MMPTPRPDVLEFLLTRSSRPARSLALPAPEGEALERILAAGARSPDHGALVPWRFLVIRGAGLARVAEIAGQRAEAIGRDAAGVEKIRSSYAGAPLIVAVVASPRPSEKIPQVEQLMSAGAVCLALVNAALASGFGAAWITGPLAADRPFLDALGLEHTEFIAGLVHMGSETVVPTERVRPNLRSITTWLDA